MRGDDVKHAQVSIHAPHEGERPWQQIILEDTGVFQSTLPTRGSDMLLPMRCLLHLVFQSTLPTRGSDRKARKI